MALKSSQLVPYLQLMRLPNAITAVADVTCGMMLVGASLENWSNWCWLASSSFCLYAGGVVLNDVCDHAQDRENRPERPIPSGRASRTVAASLATALLLIGMVLGAQGGWASGIVCVGLTVTIVLYDANLKQTRVAPVIMGACRALNLGLGMTGTPDADVASQATVVPLVLMWLYVSSVTFFARREAQGGDKQRLVLSTGGILAAVAGVLWIRPFAGGARIAFVLLVAGCVAYLAAIGTRAFTEPTPERVQHAVGRFVLGIVVLDALFTWTARGPWLAGLLLLWLVPSVLLARRIPVT